MNSPARKFVGFLLAGGEHCTPEEAWAKLAGTRLKALLQEDISLAWEDAERHKLSNSDFTFVGLEK